MGSEDGAAKHPCRFAAIRTCRVPPQMRPTLICIVLFLFCTSLWSSIWKPDESASTGDSETNISKRVANLSQKDKTFVPLATNGMRLAAVSIGLAPIQLEMKVCGDFTDQLFQIASTIAAGALLGAQVILPDHLAGASLEFSWMFDVDRLQFLGRQVYTEYWCSRRSKFAHRFWCSHVFAPAILTKRQVLQFSKSLANGSVQKLDISQTVAELQTLQSSSANASRVNLQEVGEHIWRTHFPHQNLSVTQLKEKISNRSFALTDAEHGCNLFRRLKLSERSHGIVYRLFWQVYDLLLDVNSEVLGIATHLKTQMVHKFAAVANDRAVVLGYPAAANAEMIVLEINNERCSNQPHCPDLGNVMLSEGVPPSWPVYVRSADALPDLTRFNGTVLNSIYTLVTRDDLFTSNSSNIWKIAATLRNLRNHSQMIWSAVDFLMAAAAKVFVGPSSSLSSSLVFLARQRFQVETDFHYDGETTLLERENILIPKTSTAAELFRHPMKWVFSLGKVDGSFDTSTDSALKMALAAAESAKAADVIPVCLTDAGPHFESVQLLLRAGVRVLHHTPAWLEQFTQVVLPQWRKKSDKGKDEKGDWMFAFPNSADLPGSMMRIDIPIVGLLDRFILYTDVDIMFLQPVNWETLLGSNEPLQVSEQDGISFAKPGTIGLPRFFAMSTEFTQSSDMEQMDTGVIIMNLKTLRTTYQNFIEFLFDQQQAWSYSTSDPCRYNKFYRSNNKSVANFLPHNMNWKVFWETQGESSYFSDSHPVIVHFHGPKCKSAIEPFLEEGPVQVQYQKFAPLLERCMAVGSKCPEYCRVFDTFELRGQRNVEWKPKMWSKVTRGRLG